MGINIVMAFMLALLIFMVAANTFIFTDGVLSFVADRPSTLEVLSLSLISKGRFGQQRLLVRVCIVGVIAYYLVVYCSKKYHCMRIRQINKKIDKYTSDIKSLDAHMKELNSKLVELNSELDKAREE